MKKLLCLILAVSLLAAGCGIPLIDKETSSVSTEKQRDKLPTVTPTAQAAPAKTATPKPTATVTATPTPALTPSETPTPTPVNVDYAALYTAYLKEISESRTDILGYSWQCKDVSKYGQSGNENLTPVALSDITGDGVPELIYVKGINSNGQYITTELIINTWEEGAMKNLYRGSWDAQVGGGFYYVLFTKKGSQELYAVTSSGDDVWNENHYVFERQSYGLNMQQILGMRSQPGEAGNPSPVVTYTINGQSAEPGAYSSALEELYRDSAINIMYSGMGSELSKMHLSDVSASMSYNDAAMQMTANGAVEITPSATPTPEAEAYMSAVPSKFYLSGGSNLWGADLTVNASGSFTGHYFAAEPSQTGSGYSAGTIYTADFSGRFTDFEILDTTSFWARVTDLSFNGNAGDTWTEGSTRYIRTESIGLSNGDDCVFYRTGTKTSILDGPSYNGVLSAMKWSSMPDTLSFWILYNTFKGNVFVADGGAYVAQPVLTPAPTPTPTDEPTPTPTNEPTPSGTPTPTPSGSEPALVIPDSSSKVLTEADIAGLSAAQIQLAINEIYARHGYIFKKEELKTYFSQYSWYKPSVADSEAVYNLMNDVEKKNVNFLSNHL